MNHEWHSLFLFIAVGKAISRRATYACLKSCKYFRVSARADLALIRLYTGDSETRVQRKEEKEEAEGA